MMIGFIPYMKISMTNYVKFVASLFQFIIKHNPIKSIAVVNALKIRKKNYNVLAYLGLANICRP
jgi:hypothetical protein